MSGLSFAARRMSILIYPVRSNAFWPALLLTAALSSGCATHIKVDASGKDVTATAGEIRVSGSEPVAYSGAASVSITHAADVVVQGDGSNNTLKLSATGAPNTAVFTLDQGPDISIEAQSFSFNGGAGRDLFRVDDSRGALPRFAGRAPGAHSNASFDNSGLTPADANIGIHFRGDGDDDLAMALSIPNEVSYFADAHGVAKSGVVNLNGVATMSFEGIAPIDFLGAGAGSTLVIDATSTPATTDLMIDDDWFSAPWPFPGLFGAGTAGDGVTAIVGNGGIENSRFQNFGAVIVRGGGGAETIDLIAIDHDGVLTSITLDADNTVGSDASDDTLRVQTLPAGVTATLMGGPDTGVAGDTYELANQIARPRAGEVPATAIPVNSVDGILGQVVVQPGSDEGGVEILRVIDSGDATGDAVITTATSIDGITGHAGVDITFNSADPVDSLIIDTSNTGDDVVDVDQLVMTEITADGGGHTAGDTLLVDTQAIDATDSGAVIATPGLMDVNYSNFETVNPCVSTDDDGDGVCNVDDTCPASDLSATVVIDACDSGAANAVGPDGCTISDQIADLDAGTSSDRAFTRGVRRLLRRLTRSGVISGADEAAIRSCL